MRPQRKGVIRAGLRRPRDYRQRRGTAFMFVLLVQQMQRKSRGNHWKIK